MSVAWALNAWATNSWVGMNAGPPNAWRGATTPAPANRGGHFGFDEKHRKKRFDKEFDDEAARKEALRIAFYGLPVVERELVSAAPEQTIAQAALTKKGSAALMAKIAAVMDEQQDENGVIELFYAGEI